MRRWLKWLSLTLAIVLVLAVSIVAWLGGSESGLRFALNQARGLLGDKLSVGSVEGTLFGGMRLRDVRYYDADVGDYRLGLIEIAPRSRHLLSGELYLTGVSARDVDITLAPPLTNEPPRDEPFRLPVLNAPLAMRIESLDVQGLDIRQHDGTPVLRIDTVAGRARWSGAELVVDRLDVGVPEGELGLTARIDTGADWAGEADVAFNIRTGDQPATLVGQVRLQGPQDMPSIRLSLSQPSAATLDLDWPAGTSSRWHLLARSDAFDLAGLMTEPPVRRLAFSVEGEGDLASASLSGLLELDDYGLTLERLDARKDGARVVIERLAIAETAGSGRVDASAEVDLSGEVPAGRIDARWQGINPPLAAPFDQLAASGRIEATGTASDLRARIEATAHVDGHPVQLTLHAEGDPQGDIRIAPLTLVTGNGQLDAEGTVTVAPRVAWQATVRARQFDPGLLAPDWPGRIDLDADTEGRLPAADDTGTDTIAAQMRITRLGGSLRERALGGGGRIELADGDQATTDLDVRLGDNRIRIEGRIGSALDARLRASLPDPAAFLPDASGRINADLNVRGSWPALAVEGHIDGADVAIAEIKLAGLALQLDARTDFSGDNRIQAQVRDLHVAGRTIRSLDLAAGGNEADNRLTLEVDAEQGRIRLALAGAYARDTSSWSGQLGTLDIVAPQLPEPLSLRDATTLHLAPGAATLERTCLQGANTQLCLDADWQAATGGDIGFELSRLPLTWLIAFSGDATLEASGELSGRGRIRLDADQRPTGQIHIEGTPGRIGLTETEAADVSRSELVAWTRMDGHIELDGDNHAVDAMIELSPAGSLRLRAGTQGTDAGTISLDGSLDLDLPDLSFLALLTPELVNPAGAVHGNMRLAGTLDAPQASGQVTLTGFGAEIPAAGLRLRGSSVQLDAGADGRITLDGQVRTSDDGALQIGGWIGPFGNQRLPMEITLTGDHMLAADIPAARVFISPDLRIVNNTRGLRVLGKVDVPQAMIRPELFEGGASQPSPDVHIVGEDDADVASTGLPVFAEVEVTLGGRVRIEGYGLKGSLGGKLDIRERPNRDTRALGEISVTGTYQAYGQDLDIERGRLLFSGPLGNPGLDIRAIRRIDAITAGLQVTGNAQRPILEVYSVPAMDQAEALSYLVIGRPLRQATSSEDQSALGTAATAVSTAGGDLLAKSLGARLGLDEVGVGTSRELGAGALTIGKYLSPRLYLGYGRSLFDGGQLVTLRYRLTEHFELEAQSGTRDNKAGINYRHER